MDCKAVINESDLKMYMLRNYGAPTGKYLIHISLIFLVLAEFSFAKNKKSGAELPLNGKKILILGDSITQDGTYVSYIEYFLESMFPKKNFNIISIGLSSETASGLTEPGSPFPRPCIFSRLERALKLIKPDIVTACYGMNDGIYYPQDRKRFQAYKNGILRLVKEIRSAGAKVILFTPPVFDTLAETHKIQRDNSSGYGFSRPYYKYDDVLADYSKWIMSLHIKGVTAIDFHSPMKKYLQARRRTDPEFKINKDGVHPTHLGHLLMAEIFLKRAGVPLHFKDPDDELKRVSADTLYKLINKQRKIRSEGWLDFVGYTRGKTVKTDDIKPIEEQINGLQKQINTLREKLIF